MQSAAGLTPFSSSSFPLLKPKRALLCSSSKRQNLHSCTNLVFPRLSRSFLRPWNRFLVRATVTAGEADKSNTSTNTWEHGLLFILCCLFKSYSLNIHHKQNLKELGSSNKMPSARRGRSCLLPSETRGDCDLGEWVSPFPQYDVNFMKLEVLILSWLIVTQTHYTLQHEAAEKQRKDEYDEMVMKKFEEWMIRYRFPFVGPLKQERYLIFKNFEFIEAFNSIPGQGFTIGVSLITGLTDRESSRGRGLRPRGLRPRKPRKNHAKM